MEKPSAYPDVIVRPNLDFAPVGVEINAFLCGAFLQRLQMPDSKIKHLKIKIDAEPVPGADLQDPKIGTFDRESMTIGIHPTILWNTNQILLARRKQVWDSKQVVGVKSVTHKEGRGWQLSTDTQILQPPASDYDAKEALKTAARRLMDSKLENEFVSLVVEKDEFTSTNLAIAAVEQRLRSALIRQLAMAAVPEEIQKKEAAKQLFLRRYGSVIIAAACGVGAELIPFTDLALKTGSIPVIDIGSLLDLGSSTVVTLGTYISLWDSGLWRDIRNQETRFAAKTTKTYEHSYAWNKLIKTGENWR